MERFQIVLDWLRSALARLVQSFKALFSSPSVWMAVGVVFAVGFSVGHWERSRVLKKVRADRDNLLVSSAAYRVRLDVAETETRTARSKVEEVEKELAEIKEKLAKLNGKRRLK